MLQITYAILLIIYVLNSLAKMIQLKDMKALVVDEQTKKITLKFQFFQKSQNANISSMWRYPKINAALKEIHWENRELN